METDGLDDFYKHHQFRPSKEDVVTYFLPRLLAGSPLPHGIDALIRHADVYACEPKDLAAEHAPVHSAVQKTENVYGHEGVKVGAVKHLSFKKGKASTGWVMEEFRCLRPEALVDDGEKVLCKIHLAPNACAAARQESDAYKLRQPAQQSQKRPAPVSAADPPCSKKMRMAAPVADCRGLPSVRVPVPVPSPEEVEYEHSSVWFTSAAPVSLPAEVPRAPEADDGIGRMSCTMEELLGDHTLPEEAEDFDWESLDKESEDLLQRPWDDDWETEEQQTLPIEAQNNIERNQHVPSSDWELSEEQQTLPTEAHNNIDHIHTDQPAPSTDWELSEELRSLLADHDDEEATLYQRCN
ncbi:hypothetical protein ACQ4PT_045076 [Festuca glaucescens]